MMNGTDTATTTAGDGGDGDFGDEDTPSETESDGQPGFGLAAALAALGLAGLLARRRTN